MLLFTHQANVLLLSFVLFFYFRFGKFGFLATSGSLVLGHFIATAVIMGHFNLDATLLGGGENPYVYHTMINLFSNKVHPPCIFCFQRTFHYPLLINTVFELVFFLFCCQKV